MGTVHHISPGTRGPSEGMTISDVAQYIGISYRAAYDLVRECITSDMRLLFQGATYEITAVINPGMRNVRLELLAKAINPPGGGQP